MLFDNMSCTFKVLLTGEEGLSSLKESCSIPLLDGQMNGTACVDINSFDWLLEVDGNLWYVAYILIDPLYNLILT